MEHEFLPTCIYIYIYIFHQSAIDRLGWRNHGVLLSIAYFWFPGEEHRNVEVLQWLETMTARSAYVAAPTQQVAIPKVESAKVCKFDELE